LAWKAKESESKEQVRVGSFIGLILAHFLEWIDGTFSMVRSH